MAGPFVHPKSKLYRMSKLRSHLPHSFQARSRSTFIAIGQSSWRRSGRGRRTTATEIASSEVLRFMGRSFTNLTWAAVDPESLPIRRCGRRFRPDWPSSGDLHAPRRALQSLHTASAFFLASRASLISRSPTALSCLNWKRFKVSSPRTSSTRLKLRAGQWFKVAHSAKAAQPRRH